MRTLVIFFFCLSAIVQAQLPEQYLLFGDASFNNRGSASVITTEKEVFYAGTSFKFTDEVDIRRLDIDGNIIWQHTYGDNDNEFVNNMVARNASHLVVCGDATNSFGDVDGFLLMVDTAGEQEWMVKEGIDSRNEDFYGLHIAQNGDILVTGFITGATGTGNDILVARYDGEGNQIWRTTWGEDVNDYAMGITETPGGTIFISGDRFIDGIGYNPFIAALDGDGTFLWESPVDIPYNSGCKTLRLNRAGKLMMSGESGTIASPVFNILFAQIDSSGVVDWVQYIGDELGAEAGYDLAEAEDGTYLITGFGYNAVTENNDIIVLRTDAFGNEMSRSYYGDLIVDYAYDVQTDSEGNYWVSGFSNVEGSTYFALIRNSMGLIDPVQDEPALPSFQVFPNPAFNEVTIHITGAVSGHLQLVDVSGHLVNEQFLSVGISSASMAIPHAGIWLIRLQTQQGISTLKVISLE